MTSKKKFYIDRRSGELKEKPIYCKNILRFFTSKLGMPLGMLLADLPLFSHLIGWWYRQSWTKKKILPFISHFNIDIDEFAQSIESYRSFDAFFTRTLKTENRPLAQGPIIPADGSYLFYSDVSLCDSFVVKNKKFHIKNLLNSDELEKTYFQGSIAIASLAPSDYHRFHFPCDCIPGPARLINGPLRSTDPLSIIKNIALFTENKRMLTELKTDQYGTILFIEIGAMAVGSIHQTYEPGVFYKKGEEKGYFSFGGSSIVLFFEKGRIDLATDVLANSSQHIETFCLMGQPLAK